MTLMANTEVHPPLYRIEQHVYCATLPTLCCVVKEIYGPKEFKNALLEAIAPRNANRRQVLEIAKEFKTTMHARDKQYLEHCFYAIVPILDNGQYGAVHVVVESDLIPYEWIGG